jgi:hypothetical protein
LDDWPGGILQKYSTLVPMLKEAMKELGFNSEEISRRNYLGECGEEDAVGVWESNIGIKLCCFPTIETIPTIMEITSENRARGEGLLVLINQNFFLGPLSSCDLKAWFESIETIYRLENLNVKGPVGLSIRGLLYRKYPEDWSMGRRLDQGGYELIETLSSNPSRYLTNLCSPI